MEKQFTRSMKRQWDRIWRLLRRGQRARVPFIRQMEYADCGAACLAMVATYHGKPTGLHEAKRHTGTGRDGATALGILKAAKHLGLEGHGVHATSDQIDLLPQGAILYWEGNHFVVLDQADSDGVWINDPGFGRRYLRLEQLQNSFSGIALLLSPGEGFDRRRQMRAPRVASIPQYVKQLLSYRGTLLIALAMSALAQVLALGLPVMTGLLVDRVVPQADLPLLWILGAGLLALTSFQVLSLFIRSMLLVTLRTLADKELTGRFISHLVRLPFRFFQNRTIGDLQLRVNSNAVIREILTSSMLSGLLDGIMVLIYLFTILLMNRELGLLTLVLGVFQLLIFLAARGRYEMVTSDYLAAQAKSQGFLTQLLSGMETLKVSSAGSRAVSMWIALYAKEIAASANRSKLLVKTETLLTSVRNLAPVAILLTGGLQVLNGKLSLGSMLALHALAGAFLAPLSTLMYNALQFQSVRSHMARIDDVLTTPPEQHRADATPCPKLRGDIAVESVSFHYDPGSPLVVRDVSFQVQAGQFVAIVGQSGSGKSTLAKLLLGLYRPATGTIRVDGQDLQELDLESVRSQIGVVPQQPFIFGTTIRENITLANENTSQEEVVHAAKLAQIHDDILAMPMAYETHLADGGGSLSGGQRQRIAIARALLAKPTVLVLDEATSALDTVTEKRVQSALATLSCTRVVIAQRLSTIVGADKILVMHDGQLVEQGTHRELLLQGGYYAQLVQAQSGEPAQPALSHP